MCTSSSPDRDPFATLCNRAGRAVRGLSILAVLLALPGVAWSQKFECLVQPYLEVNISSSVPGILDEVLVDRGDSVKQDQVVVRLKSDLDQAHLNLVKARAEFAARKAERNAELYLKQMISSHEKDELETEAHLLELEVREVEERLKERKILSPVNGVVVERLHSAGEFVSDNGDPILKLAQINPLRVEVAIPVEMYGRIKIGMTGRVEWEAPLSGAHSARVTVVDPVVDAASGTIGTRLELPNPNRRLPAGTKCYVTFDLD